MWWSALCLPPDTPCTELSWWALGFTPRVACVDGVAVNTGGASISPSCPSSHGSLSNRQMPSSTR